MPDVISGNPIVIVGGGLAGGNAAATLREEGFAGPVVIISPEPGVPFGRPPLSKTYLRSEEALDGWYVKPPAWYAEHHVELRTGSSVASLDPAAHTVVLRSGEELSYAKLLIATGGRNRQLSLPGAGLPGIHYLRTVAECDAIKQEAVAGRRAVIVGMGFIGCEVAASLTQLGVHVTVVFPGRAPLEQVLGGQVGELIGGIHRAKGVELLAGDQVAAFEGTERLEAVVTASGRRIAARFRRRGHRDRSRHYGRRGIVDRARTTGSWPTSCAGPARPTSTWPAMWPTILHPLFGRVRVEHYNNAEKQGAAAARSMLGSTAPYDYIYSFWSDQYEHKIEYVGHVDKWDEFVVRGSLNRGQAGRLLPGRRRRAGRGGSRPRR